MKILQLIQKKQLRGAELFACQLSKQLVQRGHDVRIAALEDGEAVLPFASIELLHTNTKLFLDWKACRQIHRIIREWKPDIIQANAGDTVRTAVFSKLLFGWKPPIVMRNASTISGYMPNGFKKLLYGFLVDRVAAVASVSAFSRNDFIQVFPRSASKIHLLPIGIDPADFELAVLPANLSNYILHVGGFTFEKNHKGLLSIFKAVLKQQPDIRLVCAGDGPLLSDIKEFVKTKGLEKHVVFLGRRSDIGGLLKGARLVVLPSIIEGLPGILLEAMYCGVPVVAYDTGGISQLVTDETGWLVPLNREDLFVENVVRILNHDLTDLADRLQNGKELVERLYTIGQVTEGFEGMYEGLIGK